MYHILESSSLPDLETRVITASFLRPHGQTVIQTLLPLLIELYLKASLLPKPSNAPACLLGTPEKL